MDKPPKPKIRISERELQDKLLNDQGGYRDRMDKLEMQCTYDEPANAASNQEPRTRSKLFKFRDNGVTVMALHCFLKVDCSLGASGKFDPKVLMVNGIIFFK